MVRIAALRAIAQRFSLALLIVTAIALMMLGKVDAVLMNQLAARLTDGVVPIMNVMSRPAATVAESINAVQELAELRDENARLRAQNATLAQYRHAAYRLEAENVGLRSITNYTPGMAHRFISGRVVADNSGSFVRSLGLNLGAADGISNGHAVLGGEGLIGRIVQTGERSARVLLITDLNARIPVVTERHRERAILAGDNTVQPRLLYLPLDAEVAEGDRVVTSGHGGMFPPGIPVGQIASSEGGEIRVRPIENLDRVEFVRVADFQPAFERGAMEEAPGDSVPMRYPLEGGGGDEVDEQDAPSPLATAGGRDGEHSP